MNFLNVFSKQFSLKSFLKDESGVTAIEMAMVGPPFFFVLMATFETGVMLFSEYALQAGVQEAGRMIRTGQAQNVENWTAQKFKSYVCNKATIIQSCNNRVSVYVQSVAGGFGALASQLPDDPIAIGPAQPGGNPTTVYNHGVTQTYTAVFVTYDWNFHMPLLGVFTNVGPQTRRLVAYTMFQNEPF